MAKHLGLSQTMVSRVGGRSAHRAETFSISKDPLFVDKVRDIVGLDVNPLLPPVSMRVMSPAGSSSANL